MILPHDWFPGPLPSNVELGERCWLYSSFAFLHYQSRRPCGVRVGHDTGIYIGTHFAVGPDGEVEIGHHGTLNGPVISTNGRVIIGDYALISFNVTIADSFAAAPPTREPVSRRDNRDIAPAPIIIGDNVWIGTRAVLLAGAKLGTGVIVGAATVVDGEVPPYAIIAGSPAKVVGWARPRP